MILVPRHRAAGGVRETRTARKLPVLTTVTGYSRWLGAVLIPTRHGEDLYAGWWQLLGGSRRCSCETIRALATRNTRQRRG